MLETNVCQISECKKVAFVLCLYNELTLSSDHFAMDPHYQIIKVVTIGTSVKHDSQTFHFYAQMKGSVFIIVLLNYQVISLLKVALPGF